MLDLTTGVKSLVCLSLSIGLSTVLLANPVPGLVLGGVNVTITLIAKKIFHRLPFINSISAVLGAATSYGVGYYLMTSLNIAPLSQLSALLLTSVPVIGAAVLVSIVKLTLLVALIGLIVAIVPSILMFLSKIVH